MHLNITNIIKTFFAGGFKQGFQIQPVDHGDYAYVRGELENRGPCPGLNALANQGYLYLPSLYNFGFYVLTYGHIAGWEEHYPSRGQPRTHDRLSLESACSGLIHC